MNGLESLNDLGPELTKSDQHYLDTIGFVPTQRVPRVRTAKEQAAWEEENEMDAKRKKIEEQLRTSQSSFSKKRKFQTITNVSTAIQDIRTTVDGRMLQFQFPEAPVTFVGLIGCTMAASREEPGKTLIREYIDAHSLVTIVDVEARVKAEIQEIVRDLFDEKPRQAEKRLVKFLRETCVGDDHDAKPFMRHLQPFDIQVSTLVCMLDSIFQQGKGQAAQLTELRNQNLEQVRQNKRQAEHNEEQAKKLEHQGIQLQEQNEKLDVQGGQLKLQGQKLDKLLLHAQNWGGRRTITSAEGNVFNNITITAPSPQNASEQRNGVLTKLFVVGKDNGADEHDQLTQTEIMTTLKEHDVAFTAVGLGKSLTAMGATTTKQRVTKHEADGKPDGAAFNKIYRFVKHVD